MAVKEGGTQCSLSNMVSFCLTCDHEETCQVHCVCFKNREIYPEIIFYILVIILVNLIGKSYSPIQRKWLTLEVSTLSQLAELAALT